MATDKLSQEYANAPSASTTQVRPGPPPPLPPREIASSSPPPPYSVTKENDFTHAGTATFSSNEKREQAILEQWRSADPRASSTQSLIPSERCRLGRRTLLLIYIHGFMGNETSFQSFPAHVHNLVSITLTETHVVHTKIYPRYKSRKAIEYARDDFSKWLEPHEGDDTDVILLGHSMGGILSAEVALTRPYSPATRQPFRHKILGTISFDTPFLGMHPGVVISGIGSLFRPAPESPAIKQTASNTLSPGQTLSSVNQEYPFPMESSLSLAPSTPPLNDPNYNQPFPNDVHIPERTGLQSVLHFINKHSDGLTSATKQYFMSHLEFGGCLADWQGLKYRYSTLRSLEDVDDLAEMHKHGYETPKRRVRFINYYTASTGRIKEPKAPKVPDGHMTDKDGNVQPIEVEMKDMSIDGASVPVPTIAVEEASDGTAIPHTVHTETEGAQEDHGGVNEVEENDFEAAPMQHIDSMSIPDDEPLPTPVSTISTENDPPAGQFTPTQSHTQQPHISEPQLPPVPEPPVEPEPLDLSFYTDKDARKLAEKEHKRVMKAYQQAVKDRESALKDRRKLIEKREKKVKQEQEKQLKAEQRQHAKDEKEEEKRQALEPTTSKEKQKSTTEAPPKPKRDKKFCLLPSDISGPKDICWERVYMEGVDEVGAHCGLFFMGPQYEKLVGDVGHRIEDWVKEDATRRAIFELHHEQD